jgi:hypothetical protein
MLFDHALYCLPYRADIEEAIEGIVKQHQEGKEGR